MGESHFASSASSPSPTQPDTVNVRFLESRGMALSNVRLDQHSAELLQQILTKREERAAVAVASNAPFSEWSKTSTDPRLAAVVDRITYRAHIIQTGTVSYRLNSR